MKKSVKIIIAVTSVLLIGGVTAFFLLRKKDEESVDTAGQGAGGEETQPPNQNTSGSTSGSATTNTTTDTKTDTQYGEWINFGWVGGQNIDGESMSGLHIFEGIKGRLKAGDWVQVEVKTGDKIYDGIHKINKLGTDDDVKFPEYKETMITIEYPKRGQASGRVRLVKNYVSFDGTPSEDKRYLNYKG